MGRLERANSTSCRTGRSGDQDNPLSPMHGRMRAIDRDLIREGHYGQRSWEPRKQAEHMAAPTNAANVKKVLANSEPATRDPKRISMAVPIEPRPKSIQATSKGLLSFGRSVACWVSGEFLQ